MRANLRNVRKHPVLSPLEQTMESTTPALDVPVALNRIFGNRDPGPAASRELLKLRSRLRGKRHQLVLVAKTETLENDHGPNNSVSRERSQLHLSILDEEELDLSIHFCAISPFHVKRHVRIDTNTDWRPSASDMPILMETFDLAHLLSDPTDRHIAICIGNDEVLSWLQRAGFPSFDWPRGDLCRDAIARFELLLAMVTLLRPDMPIEQLLPETTPSVATKLAMNLSKQCDVRSGLRDHIERSGDLQEMNRLVETVHDLRRNAIDIQQLRDRIIACGLSHYSFVRDVLARI